MAIADGPGVVTRDDAELYALLHEEPHGLGGGLANLVTDGDESEQARLADDPEVVRKAVDLADDEHALELVEALE